MVVGKDDRLASRDLDRFLVRDLGCQATFDDVVVEHQALGTLKHGAKVLRTNL